MFSSGQQPAVGLHLPELPLGIPPSAHQSCSMPFAAAAGEHPALCICHLAGFGPWCDTE